MVLGVIVALPLAGWLINGLAGGRLPRGVVGAIGCGTVGAACAASVMAAGDPAVAGGGLTATLFTWLSAGEFTVSAGLFMDRLSALMALVVTGVGFLIHVYSIGYMADDPAYARYFAYLNLFVASMLLLVLGGNPLLLFVGATGKSAQLPLYVWLPDAMEGPTPVSALIHAATMVTAGVYMIARLHPLFLHAGYTLSVVAAVGAVTAFFAATVALVEWDLKRVLAYSTISQLGYMFLAMGVVMMPAGMFHLTTHAFFKALLFLAAGSVMHAMRGVVDMRRLGGLAGPMRWTAAGFAVGGLALAGVPPFAGFFSKDLILEGAFEWAQRSGAMLVWIAGLATAFVTAVYVTRAMMLTFAGPAADPGHPHEAPAVMGLPMAVLAALSFGGGLLGARVAGEPLLRYLEPFFVGSAIGVLKDRPMPAAGVITALPVAVSLAGILAGFALYRDRREVTLGALGRFLSHQWYIETLYDAVIVTPAKRLAHLLADVVETRGIDGAVNGVGALVGRAGLAVRGLQTGFVRNYAAAILAGTILMLGYWLFK